MRTENFVVIGDDDIPLHRSEELGEEGRHDRVLARADRGLDEGDPRGPTVRPALPIGSASSVTAARS
jgi:hypothetical protein